MLIKKVFKIIFFFFISFVVLSGEELTLNRLEILRKQNIISENDYKFLKAELEGKLEENYSYSLFINRRLIDNPINIILKDNKTYLDLGEYLRLIGLKNFSYKDKVLKLELGENLHKVILDFNKQLIKGVEGLEILQEDEYYFKNNKLYLEASIFKEIFTSDFYINHKLGQISLVSKYSLPKEISKNLDIINKELQNEKLIDNLYYTNKPEFFNLGYLRFDFDKTFTKSKDIKDNDWEGKLQYQGALLYGTLTTEYDIKEKEFVTSTLHYENLPFDHYLEFESDKLSNEKWENSILIEKNRGYYEEGKKYIIKENVPLGSRVELIYLGTTIEVQNEKNGVVIFDNKEIKEDRKYILKIHRADGFIESKIIETADDFNQQNKGEFQYRVYGTERKNLENMKEFETEIYYGVTDFLTVGGLYYKTPEFIEKKDKYKYIERGGVELVYTNTFKYTSYTLDFKSEKVLTRGLYDEEDTYEGELQLKFFNLTFEYEGGKYSEFYNEKEIHRASVEYQPLDFISIKPLYEKKKEWSGEEDGYGIDIELTKSIGRILTTLEFKKDIDDENMYSANFYSSLNKNYSMRWNNIWYEKEDNFKTIFSIYNINKRNGLDYTLELAYDKTDKDRITFSVNLELENWFEFDSSWENNGDYNVSVGIDKIVDLKNIKQPIDAMDTSRVKVRTFLDKNGNNKLDKGEEYIGNVEVEIAGEKKITSREKPIYFYNIPNKLLYEFKPIVRIPGYDVTGNKFTLMGKTGGEICVDIPIKSFFNISGQLILEGDIEENQDIYSGIVVLLKNEEDEILETVMPDYLGFYDISGIEQGSYIFEIKYFKNNDILPLKMKLDFNYDETKGNTKILNTYIKNGKIERIE